MQLLAALLVGVLATTSTPGDTPEPPPFLEWEVVSRRPHDTGAYTQGLVLDDAGRLYESTGGWATSSLREVDAASGRVLRSQALPDAWFGEGLALVDDDLVQLTWKAGVALRRDTGTFGVRGVHGYGGEGWGLCYDGERLVMSDGSSRLTFRHPQTFDTIGSVEVTLVGEPIDELNELECVGDSVWANVWHSDVIVRIDPGDGAVTGLLDLEDLLDPHPAASDREAVLNGIAYDAAADTYLVTGKRWPEMVEIRLLEPGA
jgi:glutamine cyclotransferase